MQSVYISIKVEWNQYQAISVLAHCQESTHNVLLLLAVEHIFNSNAPKLITHIWYGQL